MCDRLLLPCHMGSRTPSSEDLFPFWRLDAVIMQGFIMTEDSPLLTAARNNISIYIALVFLLVSVCCDCWTKCNNFKAP